jgi:hypothetical protein
MAELGMDLLIQELQDAVADEDKLDAVPKAGSATRC